MTSENKKDVSTYEKNYGVVILLDALGMKGIWRNRDPESVLSEWSTFASVAKNTFEKFVTGYDMKMSMYTFSDTAVIILKKGTIENLVGTAGIICSIILEIETLSEIYFRGCISVGQIYEDHASPIVLGPAIDEAAQYYSLPNLIGVYASPSAQSVIDRLVESEDHSMDEMYIPYNIPFKDRIYKNGWMVRIDPSISDNLKKNLKEEFRNFQSLRDLVHYNLEHLDSIDAAEKWKNTLEFINFLIRHKKEKKSSEVHV